jgi:rRNA methylases
VIKVYLQDNFDKPEIEKSIKAKNIPLIRVSGKELERIKRAENLQGIVAQVKPFDYESLANLLTKPEKNALTLVFLDNIQDPHNLGSIARSLACLGGFAIVLHKHNSCEVTETVLHVACGGENFVPICMVANLSSALVESKKAGYWIAGAVVEGGEDISKIDLPFPLCLVVGSEGEGLRHGIEKQLELKVSLPMKGAALSYNLSVACAILCHEINKQKNRRFDKKVPRL